MRTARETEALVWGLAVAGLALAGCRAAPADPGGSQDDAPSSYATTRYRYDSAGRLVLSRTVRETDELFDSTVRHPGRSETRRLVYGCASGDLLREELDADEDGVVDGVKELARDEGGNVVAERYTGSARTSAHLSERRFGYACF